MSVGCWSAFRIWKKTAAKIFKMLWLVSFVWRMGTKLVIGRPKLGSFCFTSRVFGKCGDVGSYEFLCCVCDEPSVSPCEC